MNKPPEIYGYKIIKNLPTGGYADVYLAQYKGKRVALKILLDAFSGSKKKRSDFFAEAKLIAKFNHPNIVKIADIGPDESPPYYFSMEYYPAGNLNSYLKEKKILTTREVKYLGAEICKALIEIHGKGYLHLDLKPSNILFGENDKIVVSDFGISKYAGHLSDEDNVKGTPQYMSPEQFSGQATFASDLYSLGIMLYNAASGKLPFESNDLFQIELLHNKVAPLEISKLNPAVNKKLEKIILKSLEKKPENRYSSAAALLNEIEALDDDETGSITRRTKIRISIDEFDENNNLSNHRDLNQFPVTISKFRHSKNNYSFLEQFASTEHATIINPNPGKYLLMDHSKNGTLVNDIMVLNDSIEITGKGTILKIGTRKLVINILLIQSNFRKYLLYSAILFFFVFAAVSVYSFLINKPPTAAKTSAKEVTSPLKEPEKTTRKTETEKPAIVNESAAGSIKIYNFQVPDTVLLSIGAAIKLDIKSDNSNSIIEINNLTESSGPVSRLCTKGTFYSTVKFNSTGKKEISAQAFSPDRKTQSQILKKTIYVVTELKKKETKPEDASKLKPETAKNEKETTKPDIEKGNPSISLNSFSLGGLKANFSYSTTNTDADNIESIRFMVNGEKKLSLDNKTNASFSYSFPAAGSYTCSVSMKLKKSKKTISVQKVISIK